MPPSQSTSLPLRGQFRQMYNAIRRARLLPKTPIVFCEGDSWFSTPLAMNLLDWIVSPAPGDEERGVPLLGNGGLFFRVERSGDHAARNPDQPSRSMFVKKNIDDIIGWYEGFAFDLVLLSAGGNDFVGPWLQRTFRGQSGLSVDAAFDIVLDSGQYEVVRDVFDLFVSRFKAVKPHVPILAHTYDYPRLVGRPGALTVGNVGAAALLKKSVGPWIGPNIAGVITPHPSGDGRELRAFVKLLIDGFEEQVLRPTKASHGGVFDYVDLRNVLREDADWFDEMHPTEAGFHRLAGEFRKLMIAKLPAQKR